jgi:hypothetical protein
VTPDDQLLGPAIDKMCEGIEEFMRASLQRIYHPEEWRTEHLVELHELGPELLKLHIKLRQLGGMTR